MLSYLAPPGLLDGWLASARMMELSLMNFDTQCSRAVGGDLKLTEAADGGVCVVERGLARLWFLSAS